MLTHRPPQRLFALMIPTTMLALQMQTRTKETPKPPQLYPPVDVVLESSYDEDSEEDRFSDSESPQSESDESETSDTEQEEDIEQDAGAAMSAVPLHGGAIEHKVHDESPDESSESDSSGSGNYDSESSDTDQEEDNGQDAGEILSAAHLHGDPIKHGVQDESPDESSEAESSDT